MTRSITGWRSPQGLLCQLACSLLIGGILLPDSGFAQTSKSKKSLDAEKITGKVASVEKKGKAATLTVTKEDGETLEVNITPKIAFAVVAPGDVNFLVPNNMLSAEVQLVNQKLFAGTFIVYIGIKPETKVVPDTMNPTTLFQVCGTITAADKDGVTVNLGGEWGEKQIVFEQGGVKVTVNSADAALAPEGAPIELEGMTRSKKFLPSKVIVTLDQPLKAEDVLGDKKSGSKTKASATAKTTKGKTTKTKDDAAPAGGAATQAADPFGVIKKKDTKKEKTKAADMDAEKKTEKKATTKKPAADAAAKTDDKSP